METQDFLNAIEHAYKSEFPDSFISIEKSRSLYHSIYVICHLGKREDWNYGIRHNDLLHVMMQIELRANFHNTDSLMPDNLRLKFEHSYYMVKTDSPYKYCDSKKAGGRLSKGDSVKIISVITKYFKSLKTQLKESYDNGQIMEKDMPLVVAKLKLTGEN